MGSPTSHIAPLCSSLPLQHPANSPPHRVPITAATLDDCPNLKLVAAMAIGTDMIDLEACHERKILVCNVPAASNESVAEHAIALFFALRRNIVNMHEVTVEGTQWIKHGSLAPAWGGMPVTCKEEVMGIIGGGELGAYRIHSLSLCVVFPFS